jgi:hypothetical protein
MTSQRELPADTGPALAIADRSVPPERVRVEELPPPETISLDPGQLRGLCEVTPAESVSTDERKDGMLDSRPDRFRRSAQISKQSQATLPL